jgi:CheY-like chemotaxis protein
MPEKKKILVADDDPATLKLLDIILSGAGYDVIQASSGNDAVALARGRKPDLLVLDILLPGMSGIHVAFQLCEETATEGIPVIFISSFMEKDVVKDMAPDAESAFLQKPVNRSALLKEVERLLKLGPRRRPNYPSQV